jgi:hypothetical protein
VTNVYGGQLSLGAGGVLVLIITAPWPLLVHLSANAWLGKKKRNTVGSQKPTHTLSGSI